MASSCTGHAPERSKVEQIVVEFFAKSLHIILESRIPALAAESDYFGSSASSSTSGPKTRDRWFNLALGDCTAALENFEPWRTSFLDPMVVDVLLDTSKFAERKPSSECSYWAKESRSSPAEVLSTISNKATVLERWTVQFEQHRRSSSLSSSPALKVSSGSKQTTGKDRTRVGSGESQEVQVESKELGSGLRSQDGRNDESAARGRFPFPAHVTEVSALYKQTVIMLRSLYSTCRLLPAYRIFKLSSSPTNCCDFSLDYRVLSSVAPFSEQESRYMSVYSFTPVETAFGRMCLSVQYQSTTAVIALEVVPSILPRIIPDYVGSPTTDPLKRFTGEPRSLPISGTNISQGMHMISVPSSLQNSLSFVHGRRHSWSGRINQMQPALQPPSSPSYRVSRSPSPSYPFHPSPPFTPPPYSPYSQKQPSSDIPFSPLSSPLSSVVERHPQIRTRVSQPINIDSRCSPPLSPSPSPSPPALYPGGSEPVSIPKPSRGSKLSMGDPHQRSRSLLPPISASAKKANVLLRSSSESPRYSGQLATHGHQSRSFESPLQMYALHGDHGQQTTLSRSSSKTGLDDSEDNDFSCPFAVDDVDMDEKRNRGEPPVLSACSERLQQRSPDAAVGALIRILKSAAPLRHSSYSSKAREESSSVFGADERASVERIPRSLSTESRVQVASLEAPAKRSVIEVLEELQLYKNLRDLMLMRQKGMKHAMIGSSTLSG